MRSWSKWKIFSRRTKSSSSVGPRSPMRSEFWSSAALCGRHQAEDHPQGYATYEGVIPAGQYGGGPTLVWDRGAWIADGDDPEADLAAGAG
jgi:hypothetical protein